MKERLESKEWTAILLFTYSVLLIWIVLFHFEFSLDVLVRSRAINLIPLHLFKEAGDYLSLLQNITIFIPLGIYITMLEKSSFKRVFWYLFCISLGLELSQFVFAVGTMDITDIMANIIGGAIGVGFATAINSLSKYPKTERIIINTIMTLMTILLVALLITLWIVKG